MCFISSSKGNPITAVGTHYICTSIRMSIPPEEVAHLMCSGVFIICSCSVRHFHNGHFAACLQLIDTFFNIFVFYGCGFSICRYCCDASCNRSYTWESLQELAARSAINGVKSGVNGCLRNTDRKNRIPLTCCMGDCSTIV